MHLNTCSILIVSTLVFICHETLGLQVNANGTLIYFAVAQVPTDNEAAATCDDGFVVTNCGVKQLAEGTYYKYWDSYPANDYTCKCHGDVGSICYATCIDEAILEDYYRAKAEMQKVQGGKAYCPKNSYVLGCGIQDYQSNYEHYKSFYPVMESNGTSGCYCYDYYGASCYAFCASNIENLRIYEASDVGYASSTCDGEKYGFGCGYEPIYMTSSKIEKYPSNYQSGLEQCTAYNSHGATSYITCGDLAESSLKKT